METMPRVHAIWQHPVYQTELNRLLTMEAERPFCRHTVAHFLDVARLMYIDTLDRHLPHKKELLYAAALLHDIGRAEQYRTGTPHHLSGAALAAQILPDCGFSPAETELLCTAISAHRVPGSDDSLAGLLSRWDKASRTCFCCPAIQDCNWPEERKNLRILV